MRGTGQEATQPAMVDAAVPSMAQAVACAQANASLNALIGFDTQAATDAMVRASNAGNAGYAPRATQHPKFQGVPFVVKDNIAVAGLPLTGGCPAFANHIPAESASVVERLVQAGAVVLGKANLHELAFGITSLNAAYGPVLNPVNREHLAGGSSGGCAVAVATGMTPFAIGNDTGGSIRIPAGLCGVFGFRPTTGRYPTDGVLTLSPTRDAVGTMAQSVDWLVALDELLAQPDALNVVAVPVADAGKPVRLAIPKNPFWTGLSGEMAAACDRAVSALNAAGIETVEVDGQAIHALDSEIGFVIALYETWQEWRQSVPRRLGMSLEAMVPKIASADVRGLFEMMASGQGPGEDAWRAAMAKRPLLQAAYRDVLHASGAQALLMPTTVRAAMRLDEGETCLHNGAMLPTFPTFVRQTSPASVAGSPSVSIPAGKLASGLPFGLMLDALPGGDRALLILAQTVHDALGPAKRV